MSDEITDSNEFTISHLEALEYQGIDDRVRGPVKSRKHKKKKKGNKAKNRPTPDVSDQDLAYVQSGSRVLPFGGTDGGEVELYPFDTYRMTAAQKLGVKTFCMTSEMSDEFTSSGTYSGILFDATAVCYLCSQPESFALRVLRVDGDSIIKQIMDWARDNRITVGSQSHADLMETFGGIVGDVFTSSVATEGDNEEGEGESLGE